MSRRLAECVVRGWEDWPSFQAARHTLRAFWTSLHHFTFNTLGPALSVRIPLTPRLDRRPVCLPYSPKPGISLCPLRVRRSPCGLQTDRVGDACAEWIRASLAQASRSGISLLSRRAMVSFSSSLRFFIRVNCSSSRPSARARCSIAVSRSRCSTRNSASRWAI